MDFYPKNIDLEEIVEELDWKGNPVGGAGVMTEYISLKPKMQPLRMQ